MNNGMINNMNNMNNMNLMNQMNMMNNMNNMNNMNMMNMMNNGMMNPMNNIMMNNMMNVMPMMNNAVPMANQMSQSGNLWNLLFQRKMSRQNIQQTINILIDPEKLFIEAVNMYKIKTGTTEDFKFIFNGKDVIKDIKISQTGLQNNSTITVISLQDVEGAKYI